MTRRKLLKMLSGAAAFLGFKTKETKALEKPSVGNEEAARQITEDFQKNLSILRDNPDLVDKYFDKFSFSSTPSERGPSCLCAWYEHCEICDATHEESVRNQKPMTLEDYKWSFTIDRKDLEL